MNRKISVRLVLAMTLSVFSTSAFASSKSLYDSFSKASLQGDVGTAKKMLSEKSFKLNHQDVDGMTPLMNAALGGNLELVKAILKLKPNLELKNSEGDTALAVALTNDRIQISKELINAGAKVDILVAGEDKDTLLIQAAKNSLEITKLILNKDKALLDKANANGETPLMLSIRYGMNSVARHLISMGANQSLKNRLGETALDIAKQSANDEAQKFLMNKKKAPTKGT